MRPLKGRAVGDRLRVEDHDVGEVALAQETAAIESEVRRG
jgi:hypothetical protein